MVDVRCAHRIDTAFLGVPRGLSRIVAPERAGCEPHGERVRRRRLARAAADLRDPADPVAPRAWRGGDLRRRRRDPDDVGAGEGTHARRRRGRHRQGPGERAARPRGRRRRVHDGHRCRRGLRALGDARSAAARPGDGERLRAQRFAAGSMGPKVDARRASSRRPASVPRSARSRTREDRRSGRHELVAGWSPGTRAIHSVTARSSVVDPSERSIPWIR